MLYIFWTVQLKFHPWPQNKSCFLWWCDSFSTHEPPSTKVYKDKIPKPIPSFQPYNNFIQFPPPQKKTSQHPQIYPCPLYLNLLVRCKRNKWPKHISPSNDGFMVIYHEIESAKKQIQDEGLLKISQLIQLMKFHSKRTIAQIPLPQNL